MRFLTAVALAVVMLWVPVDGVAQTEAQRRLLELYESREEELLASIDPEADEQRENVARMRCAAAPLADRMSCLTQVYELVTPQAVGSAEQTVTKVRYY